MRPPIWTATACTGLNAWVSPGTAEKAGEDIHDPAGFDYGVLDEVIPHPVYAKQSWVSVLNPGPRTNETLKTLLAEAHDRARQRYEKTNRSFRSGP